MTNIHINAKDFKDNVDKLAPYVSSGKISINVKSLVEEHKDNPIFIKKIVGNSLGKHAMDPKFCKFIFTQKESIVNLFVPQITSRLITDATRQYGYWHYGSKGAWNDFKSTMTEISNRKNLSNLRASVRKGLLSNYKKIQSQCKPKAFQCLMEWSTTDDEKIEVLKVFKGSIGKKILIKHIQELPKNSGLETGKVLGVVNSRVFDFKKTDIKDHKKRVQLAKDISKQNTSIQYLRHKVELTKADLLAMPAISRFKFIQWFYDDHFQIAQQMNFASTTALKSKITNRKKSYGRDKIKIADLSYKDMEELLFSVAFKKNNKVTAFLNKYKKFDKLFDKNTVIVGKGYWS